MEHRNRQQIYEIILSKILWSHLVGWNGKVIARMWFISFEVTHCCPDNCRFLGCWWSEEEQTRGTWTSPGPPRSTHLRGSRLPTPAAAPSLHPLPLHSIETVMNQTSQKDQKEFPPPMHWTLKLLLQYPDQGFKLVITVLGCRSLA